jgi:hypothetical protein
MKSRFSRLPSHSTVIACVALFLALGGLSYAASKGHHKSKITTRSTTVLLANPTCTTIGSTSFCNYPATPVTASCKKGEHAVGGGYQGSNSGTPSSSQYSFSGVGSFNRPDPIDGTPTGWSAEGVGNTSGPDSPPPSFTVYAVCSS